MNQIYSFYLKTKSHEFPSKGVHSIQGTGNCNDMRKASDLAVRRIIMIYV